MWKPISISPSLVESYFKYNPFRSQAIAPLQARPKPFQCLLGAMLGPESGHLPITVRLYFTMKSSLMSPGCQGQFQMKYELFGWMARVKITWDNRNSRILVAPISLKVYINIKYLLQSEFLKQ